MDGEIEPDRLETKLDGNGDGNGDGDDPLVVDIRNPPAFEQGHIPDSVNVPLSRLTQDIAEVADADHIVTVCPHGKASVKAARLIAAYDGFDGRVDSLEGGLTAWDGPMDRAGAAAEDSDEGPNVPF
jgi:rhodanese-related sulfurtransferase